MASEANFRNFTKVFSKIDTMIEVLNEETKSDTTKKEDCESNLSQDLNDTKNTKSDISDIENTIEKVKGEINRIDATIAEKEEEIKAAQEELAKAKENRDAENADYLKNKDADDTAMSLLKQAIKVLQGFYASSSGGTAGEAQSLLQEPAGAPETFGDDATYSGSTADGNKVISAMEDAEADLQKDMDTADLCEKNGVTMYEDAKTSLEGQITTLQTQIDGDANVEGLKEQKSNKKEQNVENNQDLTGKNGVLAAIQKKMKDAKPFCDYIVNKFAERQKSRDKELQGLETAKTILDKYKPT